MATAGERNKVIKILDKKGYDPTLIEDPAPFTVEISRYKEVRRAAQEPGRELSDAGRIAPVTRDAARGGQAAGGGESGEV